MHDEKAVQILEWKRNGQQEHDANLLPRQWSTMNVQCALPRPTLKSDLTRLHDHWRPGANLRSGSDCNATAADAELNRNSASWTCAICQLTNGLCQNGAYFAANAIIDISWSTVPSAWSTFVYLSRP
ncbi:hypothetical protein T4B_7188 [Trichinella pseudospiralis]|uniref:Uncharacterized protein n=2 Tax=Trichinella pseudospiralis TaxID=6337 RepID=A0A0V1FK07_TRIPS|nr:hypothetical protein T4A_185 [Trichinella pseudospiralis]KRY86047.1 hypothetical protein T4D_1482 [Trichinella pseudospiralis]KRZ30361.1 hypothetical protein T4B_7188 [Trichinella pseudospiralis]